MNVHRLRLKSGEEVEIRETDAGYVCPVCGFTQLGDPPYAWSQTILEDGRSLGPRFGAPSFDVCPSCGVEYGNDDYNATQSVVSMWRRLRIDWLNESGWSEDALRQVDQNLGITEEQARREADETGDGGSR